MVYNNTCPPEVSQESSKNEWRHALAGWYEQNKGKTLSDHPEALLSLYKSGKLSLPQNSVNELAVNVLHRKNAQESIAEYRAGSTKNRKHTFHEVSATDFNCAEYKKAYEGIRGDALKRSILKSLKDSLEDVQTIDDLKEKKSKFLNSPEMEIIDKAQGKTTQIFGAVGLKTDSHYAVIKLFKEAEERINNNNPLSSPHKM